MNNLRALCYRLMPIMVVVLLYPLGGIAHANDSEVTPDIAIAVDFVRKTRINGNFKVIVARVVQVTTTFAMLATEHPITVVPVFREKLYQVTANYQDEWDRNLAESYLAIFTANELASLTEQGRKSPYFGKFQAEMENAGEFMKQRSEPLAAKASAEILSQMVMEMGLGSSK